MGVTQVEAIATQLSLGAHRANAALAGSLDADVEMSLAETTRISDDEARHRLDRLVENHTSAYLQTFHGELPGFAALALRSEDAASLAAQIPGNGCGHPEPRIIVGSAFQEIGSILVGAVLSALAERFPYALVYDLPTVIGRSHFPIYRLLGNHAEQILFCSAAYFSSKDFGMNGEFLLGICPAAIEELIASTADRSGDGP